MRQLDIQSDQPIYLVNGTKLVGVIEPFLKEARIFEDEISKLKSDHKKEIAELKARLRERENRLLQLEGIIKHKENSLSDLKQKLEVAVEGFDKLSKLGNGDLDGNSRGNEIAQEYRAKLRGEA